MEGVVEVEKKKINRPIFLKYSLFFFGLASYTCGSGGPKLKKIFCVNTTTYRMNLLNILALVWAFQFT